MSSILPPTPRSRFASMVATGLVVLTACQPAARKEATQKEITTAFGIASTLPSETSAALWLKDPNRILPVEGELLLAFGSDAPKAAKPLVALRHTFAKTRVETLGGIDGNLIGSSLEETIANFRLAFRMAEFAGETSSIVTTINAIEWPPIVLTSTKSTSTELIHWLSSKAPRLVSKNSDNQWHLDLSPFADGEIATALASKTIPITLYENSLSIANGIDLLTPNTETLASSHQLKDAGTWAHRSPEALAFASLELIAALQPESAWVPFWEGVSEALPASSIPQPVQSDLATRFAQLAATAPPVWRNAEPLNAVLLQEGSKLTIESVGGSQPAHLALETSHSLSTPKNLPLTSHTILDPAQRLARLDYLSESLATLHELWLTLQLTATNNDILAAFSDYLPSLSELLAGLRPTVESALAPERLIAADLKGELPSLPLLGALSDEAEGTPLPRLALFHPILDSTALAESWEDASNAVTDSAIPLPLNLEAFPAYDGDEDEPTTTYGPPIPLASPGPLPAVSTDTELHALSTAKDFTDELWSQVLEKPRNPASGAHLQLDLKQLLPLLIPAEDDSSKFAEFTQDFLPLPIPTSLLPNLDKLDYRTYGEKGETRRTLTITLLP